MINFDITEYNFLRKDTAQYELSILYGMDSFAYTILDAKANVLALREYHWPEGKSYASLWESDEKLQYNYQQMTVAFGQGGFCMVPQRLFQEEEKATYLGHISGINHTAYILSDNISQHQAELVYEANGPALTDLDIHSPTAHKSHLHTVLLDAMRSHAATQHSYHIGVVVQAKQLFIYAFDRTNLMLTNSYVYNSAQDFIYYVLLVYEQLGIKVEHAPLYIGGRLLEDSDIYRSLVRYVKNVSFLSFNGVKRGPQLERYPLYFFYDLYALANYRR